MLKNQKILCRKIKDEDLKEKTAEEMRGILVTAATLFNYKGFGPTSIIDSKDKKETIKRYFSGEIDTTGRINEYVLTYIAPVIEIGFKYKMFEPIVEENLRTQYNKLNEITDKENKIPFVSECVNNQSNEN